MRLKPKSTVHNPRALLYKRFTDLESAEAFRVIYRTDYLGERKFWVFDTQLCRFKRTELSAEKFQHTEPVSEYTIYKYNNYGFRFFAKTIAGSVVYSWEKIDLSTLTKDGVDVSIDITIGTMGVGNHLVFSGDMFLDNVSTKPVELVNVLQTTGVPFYDCYVDMFLGDTIYHFGGDGVDEQSAYQVPSGTATALYNNRTYANNTDLANCIEIGGLVNTTEITELSATITFTAKGLDLLSALYNDIARYQTNKYYLAGSFDYMIRGSIGSSDTQPIKGNIMHLRSFEIKYFDDRINIDHDDLVVIDGHLYGVEELSYDIKRSPKPYTVYFATLNNIK